MTGLHNLAGHSRVWIFQADRPLTAAEATQIHQTMKAFIPQWASHGNELYGDYELVDNLFLIVGADEAKSPTSGCAIDSLTRCVKELGMQLKVDFFNRLAIAYINDTGKLDIVGMPQFKTLIREHKINENTIVFNNLVQTKEEWLNGWKTAVKNSWHSNLFELA